jgi:glyoxylase-like metal-dependent hydrolase (beta-lactamase superfamily II)
MGRGLILALVCAILPAGQAHAQTLRSEQIAPGVHVFIGTTGEAAADNAGRIGNLGVIIGTRASLVIGTGSSDAHGTALLTAVAQLSDKPVLMAVNLQATPEHVLGNTAFARHGIAIFAHRDIDAYMASHCQECLKTLSVAVGQAALEGTQALRPTQLVDGSTSVDLGGRIVDLIWLGGGPRPGVLAVFDRASRVLFAAALATFDVVPDARDADIDSWLANLRDLTRLRPRWIVPGSGRPGRAARLDEVTAYLTGLQQGTRTAYARNMSITSAAADLRLPRFESWALYGTRHPRNVHFEYLRCEARDLGTSPDGAIPAPDRTD